jgi:hypothetical protein
VYPRPLEVAVGVGVEVEDEWEIMKNTMASTALPASISHCPIINSNLRPLCSTREIAATVANTSATPATMVATFWPLLLNPAMSKIVAE